MNEFMSKEERHLRTKIALFEDALLRSRNKYDQETIQKELRKMRTKLMNEYVLKGTR